MGVHYGLVTAAMRKGCKAMTRYAATLALLLSACIHHPIGENPDDARAARAVESAWSESGLPPTGDCMDRVTIVRHREYAEFKEACRNVFARTADTRVLTGCSTWGFSAIPWRDVQYVAHIAPGNTHEYTTVIHEGVHILAQCTGLVADADPLHRDARLWASVGGDASVQSRALRVP